jgi:hypothetical protein
MLFCSSLSLFDAAGVAFESSSARLSSPTHPAVAHLSLSPSSSRPMGSGNSKGGKAKAVKAEKLAVMPELVRCVHVLGRGLGRRGAAATSLKT